MSTLRLRFFSALFSTCFVFLFCSSPVFSIEPEDSFDFGKWEKNDKKEQVYRNELFGMTLTVPESWLVAPPETMKMFSGPNVAVVDPKKKPPKVKDIVTAFLFMVNKKPMQFFAEEFNANINITVENPKNTAGEEAPALTLDDYMETSRNVLKTVPMYKEAEFQEKPEKKKLGGVEFRIMRIKTAHFRQEFWATKKDGMFIIAVLSYGDDQDDDKKTLVKIAESIRFESKKPGKSE